MKAVLYSIRNLNKGGDMMTNMPILADLEDLIYGNENAVSCR